MRLITNSLFPAVAVLLAASLFTACSPAGEGVTAQGPGQGGRGRGGGGQGPAIPVTTASVERQAVPLTLRAIGVAEPSQTVAVHAQITGQLTAINFKEGDDVEKGQLLFTLDRRPLEAALAQAQANLARDTAQLNNARASAARYQDLLDRGIATKEQADTARTTAAALEATVGADGAALDNAKVQLEYSTISAPLSGRTGSLLVQNGNLVRANDATPLVIINQVTPLNVTFGIPEGSLSQLKHYMAQGTLKVLATLPNDPSASATGDITFIDNNVDQTTGSIKIKGSFPNLERRLWPGQFINVVVTLTTDASAIVVPTVAVQTGQQGSYVFIVKPGNTVDLRPVNVERTFGDKTVIKDGLTPGDVIILDGQVLLVQGSRISVKSGPGAPDEKATS